MPHRRSKQGKEKRKTRHQTYEQGKPRYSVACKEIHVVTKRNNSSLVMKHQRKAIGICQNCGNSENLHVHHIDHNRENNLPENLMVLCQPCHIKLHYLEKQKCPIAINEAQKRSVNVIQNIALLNKERLKPTLYVAS